MNAKIYSVIGLLCLAACDSGPTKSDVTAANVTLTSARIKYGKGEPIERAALEAMPGMQAALEEDGRAMRDRLAQQMKDPTSVIWGDLWTVDYVHVCGEVNAKNSFGAYTGRQTFYSDDGVSARLPGHPLWKAEDLAHCSGGPRRLILPADPAPN